MSEKIIVSGVGCCLVDLLFNGIDFQSDVLLPLMSKVRGDGGLTPGQLVFQEEFEKYCGLPFSGLLDIITGGRGHDKINIGGPSIVSLINAAQLSDPNDCDVRFYGRGGNDGIGQYLLSALSKTPVVLKDYQLTANRTPSTVVLSDPSFDHGHGERMFLNSIGAAWDYTPDQLGADFFDSDIVVFGGTALVPHIHDSLTTLLKRAKSAGCVTIVNTVFDFRNEKGNPSQKWPMGESDESYQFIDLLITDLEEALRLSGATEPNEAMQFFIDQKVSSLIVTNGAKPIAIYSDGRCFKTSEILYLPVSQRITDDLKLTRIGDTTGCGDNFVGGVIAAVVGQLQQTENQPDLKEACCWGVVSGGFTCFYMGGTYFEENAGEKKAKMLPYYESYRKQIGN